MSIKKEIFIQDSLKPIPINSLETILYQMKNCICEIHKGEKKGTGFLVRIPYINNSLTVLITNEHVFGLKDVIAGINITLSLNNLNKTKDIKINSKRKIYINEILDVTIIEIKKEQDNINDFLSLDEQIYNFQNYNNINYYNNIYKGQSIYLLNYMGGNEIFSSFGLLNGIENYEISHKCSTDQGSSGSPIILLNNNKVIGVHHTGSAHKFKMNFGTLLAKPILDFQKISNSNLLVIKKNNIQYSNIYNMNLNISNYSNNTNNILTNLDQNLISSITIKKERKKLLDEISQPNGNKNDAKKEYYLINKNYLRLINNKFNLEKIFCLMQANQNKNGIDLLNIVKANLDNKTKKDLSELNKQVLQKLLLNSKEAYGLNYFHVNNDKSNNLLYYKQCDIISQKIFEVLSEIDDDINSKCQKIECVFDKNIIIIFINKFIINIANFDNGIFVKQIIISNGQNNSYNLSQIFNLFAQKGYQDFMKSFVTWNDLISFNINQYNVQANIFNITDDGKIIENNFIEPKNTINYSSILNNKKLWTVIYLYINELFIKRKLNSPSVNDEDFCIISKRLLSHLQTENNYSKLKKYFIGKITEHLQDEKDVSNIIKSLPQKDLIDLINNLDKNNNNTIYNNSHKIDLIPIQNPYNPNEIYNILDNFELIEKHIGNEYLSHYPYHILKCSIIGNNMIIFHYPNNKFNNKKYMFLVSKIDDKNNFKNEYLLIYDNPQYINHFQQIKANLYNYLSNQYYINNTAPIVANGYIEIGIILKI